MIKAVVTSGGYRANGKRESWVKFDAPQTELASVAPFMFLIGVTLYMAVEFDDGSRKLAGKSIANNFAVTPKNNAILTLRGNTGDLHPNILDALDEKTFTLLLLTEIEVQQLIGETPSDQDTGLGETTHDTAQEQSEHAADIVL